MRSQTFTVPDMSCAHCERVITAGVSKLPGVERVEIDLERKLVTVRGESIADRDVRAAIDEAGYEVAG